MMPDEPFPPDGGPPRAGAFIVTIYGDVVEPRGGALWMGSLVEVCRGAGISETLVRTAVSRLVASGRIEGERRGRRSFYRLTARGRAEFQRVARLVFAPPDAAAPPGWVWVAGAAPSDAPALAAAGYAEFAPGLWLGAGGELPPTRTGALMRASTISGQGALAALAARHWDLDAVAAAYRRVLARHGPLAERAMRLQPPEALMARLRLVHDFRTALLGDPRLPAEALPADWPGRAARELFASLYAEISPAAEAEIARAFRGAEGPLPQSTAETRARLDGLLPATAA